MLYPRSTWPRRWSWGVVLAAACTLLPGWSAAEGPETPGERSSPVSEKVDRIVADYFAALSDSGYLAIYDEVAGRTLKLNRPQVHGEIRKTGDASYAVCVEARTEDDRLYDLDFFVEKQPSGFGVVTEVAIHKDADQLRYIWEQQNGVWSRKTLN